jgi:hypothetical protein
MWKFLEVSGDTLKSETSSRKEAIILSFSILMGVNPFSSLGEEDFDIGLCSEYSILPYFEKLNATAKIFYFLLKGHKQEKETIKKNYFFLGNSEGLCRHLEKKYNISCSRAPGGVNPQFFFSRQKSGKVKEASS